MNIYYCVDEWINIHGRRIYIGINDMKEAEQKPENSRIVDNTGIINSYWFDSYDEARKFIRNKR